MKANMRVTTITQNPVNQKVELKLEVDVESNSVAHELLMTLAQEIKRINSTSEEPVIGFLKA